RRAGKALIDRSAVDDQYRLPAERVELRTQRLGLGLGDGGGIDDDELAFGLLGGQSSLKTEPPHLLLQIKAVATHDRTKDHAAAAELRGAQTALTSAAGALLLVGLFRGAADLADAFCLVGAGAPLGQLPVDHSREDVAAHRYAEHVIGQFD